MACPKRELHTSHTSQQVFFLKVFLSLFTAHLVLASRLIGRCLEGIGPSLLRFFQLGVKLMLSPMHHVGQYASTFKWAFPAKSLQGIFYR